MAVGSTPVSSSSSKGMSTTRTPWLTGGSSTSSLAVAPPAPSSYDQAGELCAPPSGEMGSPISLLSSSTTSERGTARVTSNPTSVDTIGIAAITAASVLTTGRKDATPIKEGRTSANLLPSLLITTHYRLGLHYSRMGGWEMPSPASPWLLSNKHRLVTLKNSTMRTNGSMNTNLDESGRTLKPRPANNKLTRRGSLGGHDPRPLRSIEGGGDPVGPCSAYERPRPLAHGETTGATGGASPHWGSHTRVDPEDVGEQSPPLTGLCAPPH